MAVLSSKLILSAAALLTLYPATAESPVGAAAPSVSPAIRIEHQLVEALERPGHTTAEPRRRQRLPPRPSTLQFAVRSAESPGLAARAGRILFGDGRFRPEPFPRPGR